MSKRIEFNQQSSLPAWERNELTLSHLDALRMAYGFPDHVDIVPTGEDYANRRRPGFCAFHDYAFRIGYNFPINPLAKELCRFFRACPAQLTPYTLKVCRILTTHADKAGSAVTIYHLFQIFNVCYMRGLMLHLIRRGKKSFVQSDDKANRGF